MLENDDDEAVQRLIDEGKAERFPSSEFLKEYREDLQQDHDILLEIKKL
jgi:3-methyladenine DNA glycosylase AlkC